MSFIFVIAITLFILLCVLLCGVILMQEGKGGGLGASFGGDSGDSVFGTATAEVLKKFTAYLAVAFFVSCIFLSLWTSAMGRSHSDLPTYEMEETEG